MKIPPGSLGCRAFILAAFLVIGALNVRAGNDSLTEDFSGSLSPGRWSATPGAVAGNGSLVLDTATSDGTRDQACGLTFSGTLQCLNFLQTSLRIELEHLDIKRSAPGTDSVFMLFLADCRSVAKAQYAIQLRIDAEGKAVLWLYALDDKGQQKRTQLASIQCVLPLKNVKIDLDGKSADLSVEDSSGIQSQSCDWNGAVDPAKWQKSTVYLMLQAVTKKSAGTTEVTLKKISAEAVTEVPAGNARLPAEDRVTNGSFEATMINNQPDQWEIFCPVPPAGNPDGLVRGTAALFDTDTAVFHEGHRSMRISSPAPVRCAILQRSIPCHPGETCSFAVWMKGRGLDAGADMGAAASLSFLNSTNPALTGQLTAETKMLRSEKPDFDWQKFETTTVVPAGADTMQVEMFLWKSKGTVWFDDASVTVQPLPGETPSQIPDRAGKARYREADKIAAAVPKTAQRVLFLGDSITDRWDLKTFFPEENFINRGIGGQLTWQMLSRFQQDVLDLKPDLVFILAGTNDLGGGLPEDSILGNIRAMIRTCRQHVIRVVVCSILPVSDYTPGKPRTTKRPPETILDLNKGIREICSAEGVRYLDIHSLLVDKAGLMPANMSPDGLHPNADCYKIISPKVLAAIQEELASTQK